MALGSNNGLLLQRWRHLAPCHVVNVLQLPLWAQLAHLIGAKPVQQLRRGCPLAATSLQLPLGDSYSQRTHTHPNGPITRRREPRNTYAVSQ